MNQLTDQEMITDVLSSQKFVTGNYNTVANEAKSHQVHDAFMSILKEEHDMQFEVFNEMQSRGWYPTENAEQQKVNAAKQKFSSCC